MFYNSAIRCCENKNIHNFFLGTNKPIRGKLKGPHLFKYSYLYDVIETINGVLKCITLYVRYINQIRVLSEHCLR